jgi:hypothetical protein
VWRVDRCALFVDAGYVLADGAMAVHGTRRRESVTWDYGGLLQLLSSLAVERSGLPLLRCYWYEATVEGRRTADHDALADLPGVKLRLAKMRPGRREGVESEIHRDLTTLARNGAVSDAMVVSSEEDLAQVIADVQDLGMRVTLLHIAVDGNWTISRTLRQECDDIVEISSAHLRPYVELISGAEPSGADEQDVGSPIRLRPQANGHANGGRMAPYVPATVVADNGHQAPPTIYTAPVVAEYQRSDPQLSPRQRREDAAALAEDPQPEEHTRQPMAQQELPVRPDPQGVRQDIAARRQEDAVRQDQSARQPDPVDPARRDVAQVREEPQDPQSARHLPAARYDLFAELQDAQPIRQDLNAHQDAQPIRRDLSAHQDLGARQDLAGRQELPARPEPTARQDLYPAPVALPGLPEERPTEMPAARSRTSADLSGYNPGATRDLLPHDPLSGDPSGMDRAQPMPAATGSAQIRRLPARSSGNHASPTGAQQAMEQQPLGQPPTGQQPPAAPPATGHMPASVTPITPGTAGYLPGPNGAYSGPQPTIPAGPGGSVGLPGLPGQAESGQAGGTPGLPPQPGAVPVSPANPANVIPGSPATPAVPAGAAGGPVGPAAYQPGQPAVSLAEAVQSAHEEGQEFGSSVARDAPALWLEAVLARKPRMPSDLEARLLQGSSLPIDFLLHDEVRHALRRGFWDALERARR